MRARCWFLLVPALLLALPAVAEGNKGGKAPPARTEKPKDPKAKDEKRPAEVELATEVMVLHATNSGKGIDSAIGKMPELKKPPFSSYDSYALLSKTRLPLSKDDKTIPGRMTRAAPTRRCGGAPIPGHSRRCRAAAP